MRSRRVRLRLLGAALAIYGLIGIIMFIVIAVNVARPLERARQLSESVDQERAALVASLGQAETTIRGMSTSVGNMDTSLSQATTAINQATSVAHQAATSMYGLRDAMGVSILGAQPLIGLAANFDATGQNLDTLGNNVASIGTALDQNRTDVATTRQNLSSSSRLGPRSDCLRARRPGREYLDQDARHGSLRRLRHHRMAGRLRDRLPLCRPVPAQRQPQTVTDDRLIRRSRSRKRARLAPSFGVRRRRDRFESVGTPVALIRRVLAEVSRHTQSESTELVQLMHAATNRNQANRPRSLSLPSGLLRR